MKRLCKRCSKELVFIGAACATGTETYCCEQCDWGISRCSVEIRDDRAIHARSRLAQKERRQVEVKQMDYNKGDRGINRLLGITDADVAAHAAKRPLANSLSGAGFHFTEPVAVMASEPDDDEEGEMPKRGPNAAHHFARVRELLDGAPGEKECRMAIAHLSHAQTFLGD
jgi:hypothetical protein